MAMELLTLDDLQQFKTDLFNELQVMLQSKPDSSKKRWLKSHEVERLLKISTTKLQNMRVEGIIPYSKIGNTIFYDIEDVNTVIESFKMQRNGRRR